MNVASGDVTHKSVGACFTKLTELFDEVCFCTTPNKPWKCPCEKPCLLTQPMLFNYDSKSYVLFAVENEAEKSICINPHLEKYQQYFHVANVFAVYMDNVDAATSADDLRVWYKESGKWDRSLLKVLDIYSVYLLLMLAIMYFTCLCCIESYIPGQSVSAHVSITPKSQWEFCE